MSNDIPVKPKKSVKEFFIGKKLGQGSYASVHVAHFFDSHGTKVVLACKIFNKSKAPKDFLNKFFPRELEILRKLNDPNVIQIHNIVDTKGKVFIFMNLAERGDLYDYLKTHGPIPERKARRWFEQMMKGLKYLHENGIAHRDLKCENVLLTKDYNILITDFGFSKYCVEGEMSQTYCGSATYAAPEILGGVPYKPKIADVWSLGIVLFVMLNASFPFDDSCVSKLLLDQMNRNFSFSPYLEGRLSNAAKALVMEILEPNAQLRYSLDRIIKHTWFKRNENK